MLSFQGRRNPGIENYRAHSIIPDLMDIFIINRRGWIGLLHKLKRNPDTLNGLQPTAPWPTDHLLLFPQFF